MDDLDDWEVVGGEASIHDEPYFGGSQSIQIDGTASEEQFGIKRRFDQPIDLSSQDVSIAFDLREPRWESLTVELMAPDGENTVVAKRGVWEADWVRLDLGPRRVKGSPNMRRVRGIRIGMYTGGGTQVKFRVGSIRAVPRQSGEKALLTFDDNHISQYETAFPMMDRFDYSGLVAAIPWADDGERISVSGLTELRDAGWDVASHPQREKSLRALSPEAQRKAIRSTKRWLLDNGFEQGARFTVWPLGRYGERTLSLARKYHHLGFTTDGSLHGSITGPMTVSRVSGTDIGAVKQAIDLASSWNQTLVLNYHRVGDYDSGVSAEGFEETLSYLDSSSLDVITASELVDGAYPPGVLD